MKMVIAIMPLPEWEIDGVKYKATSPTFVSSPPGFDQHVSVNVGTWLDLPAGDAGIAYAARLRAQNGDVVETKPGELPRFKAGAHPPTMQRFAFEVREVGEANDALDELFVDTPIRRLDGTSAENPWKAARREVDTLKAGLEKAADTNDSLSEENKALNAERDALKVALDKADESNRAALEKAEEVIAERDALRAELAAAKAALEKAEAAPAAKGAKRS